MARYLVQIPLNTLSEDRKAGIAKSIVAAHHEITGDNPDAVQVAVTEIDAGCFFADGRLIECDHIFVHGYMPGDGHFAERKTALVERLAGDATAAADFEPDSTWVTISDDDGERPSSTITDANRTDGRAALPRAPSGGG